MGDVRVRPARRGDVAGIQAVADAAWHAVYDDIIGPERVDEVLGEWYEGEDVEAGVDHDAQDFFVAVRDGERKSWPTTTSQSPFTSRRGSSASRRARPTSRVSRRPDTSTASGCDERVGAPSVRTIAAPPVPTGLTRSGRNTHP